MYEYFYERLSGVGIRMRDCEINVNFHALKSGVFKMFAEIRCVVEFIAPAAWKCPIYIGNSVPL